MSISGGKHSKWRETPRQRSGGKGMPNVFEEHRASPPGLEWARQRWWTFTFDPESGQKPPSCSEQRQEVHGLLVLTDSWELGWVKGRKQGNQWGGQYSNPGRKNCGGLDCSGVVGVVRNPTASADHRRGVEGQVGSPESDHTSAHILNPSSWAVSRVTYQNHCAVRKKAFISFPPRLLTVEEKTTVLNYRINKGLPKAMCRMTISRNMALGQEGASHPGWITSSLLGTIYLMQIKTKHL